MLSIEFMRDVYPTVQYSTLSAITGCNNNKRRKGGKEERNLCVRVVRTVRTVPTSCVVAKHFYPWVSK